MSGLLHVISMSGGKDSTATAILALETQPRESLRFAFADTGNEHQATYAYIDYLEQALGVAITRLRRDFSDWWWHRRNWIAEHGTKKHGNPAATARMLAVFDKGPSGNPFLDLCMIKGAFPTARRRFCTTFLKTEPMAEYQMALIDDGHAEAVWSWQGIRADESARRSRLPSFEDRGGGHYINRPILRWTAADVFEAHRCAGIEPNPLYRQGMTRVGCMPCILVGKEELRQTAARFPEHIDRIAEWEEAVAEAAWRGWSAFFIGTDRRIGREERGDVRRHVLWSQTGRGGDVTQPMLGIDDIDAGACSSAYGLCE